MISNYAMIENGVVTNVCLWDGETPFNPGDDITLVIIPEGSLAWIGWNWTESAGFTESTI